MKKCVSRKLRSENGASITFALLLFLVCAVVGMIIITAGTAASGRLADKIKMDQRYYKTISAAGVLKEEFDNKKVTLIRKMDNSSGSTVYSLSYDTGTKNIDGETIFAQITDIENFMSDFLTMNSVALLNCSSLDVNLWNADFYNTVSGTKQYTFEVSGGSGTTYSLPVEAQIVNGVVELLISSDKDPDAGTKTDKYILKMTLVPDVSEVVSVDDDFTTKTASITWLVRDIEKVNV